VRVLVFLFFKNKNDNTWNTFKNLKYKYSFEYPKDWKIQDKGEGFVDFYSNKGSLIFRDEEMANIVSSGFKIDSKKEIEVAGEKAIKIFSSGGNEPGDTYTSPLSSDIKMIAITFAKNNIYHLITINNLNEYAEVSDPIEMEKTLDQILKTIKFK